LGGTECRLSSPAGERLDYVGGLYFYHDKLWSNSDQLNGSQYAGFNGIAVTDPGAVDGVLQNTIGTPVVDSYAAFAQANVHFTESWTLTAGLRETSEHKSASIINTISGGSDPSTLSASDLAARIANTDTSTAAAMLLGRFFVVIPILAIAGNLAKKRLTPASLGTFPVTGPLFTVLLVSTILIVGALTFFPALSLGPILEHVPMAAGKAF